MMKGLANQRKELASIAQDAPDVFYYTVLVIKVATQLRALNCACSLTSRKAVINVIITAWGQKYVRWQYSLDELSRCCTATKTELPALESKQNRVSLTYNKK